MFNGANGRMCYLMICHRLDKWDNLMIPYSDLPEEEKEKDRAYALKVKSIFSD